MSSSDTTKKRKIEGNNVEEDSLMSAILAEMKDMKCKLTRMDELESRSTLMQNEINSMKDRVSHIDELENKCALLQRSMKIMSSESNWEYSAPAIPRSYWSPDYDEEIIDDVEQFLVEIKDQTRQLRSGELPAGADIILAGYDDDHDFPLPYDNALLPHWREFSDAIQVYPDVFNDFTIENIELLSSIIELLKRALQGKLNNILMLKNNEYENPREGIEFAVQLIKTNHNLKEFNWINNQMGSTENARYLVDAIINLPLINHVRLENCFGAGIDGYDAMKLLLASDKRFDSIDFDRNNIQINGGTELSDYIATNPPLENLHLEHNNLNDNDAQLIAQALRQNTNLRNLHLGNNKFTDIGVDALSKVVYDGTSLNSVSECNHSCYIVGIDGKYIGENYNDTKINKSRKIYSLLSFRNKMESNVHNLNTEFGDGEDESTLKLVPKVLESVHRHSISVVPKPVVVSNGIDIVKAWPKHLIHKKYMPTLSIMFEIMRGWLMPELYETRVRKST